MALQQRPMGEDPGAPSSEIRERGKPWGFPQLSALGSLAEFWLLWNEGSPQTPVEDRKPVKVSWLPCVRKAMYSLLGAIWKWQHCFWLVWNGGNLQVPVEDRK